MSTSIRDLLKVVDPVLVGNYERNVLDPQGSGSLLDLDRKLEKIKTDKKNLFRRELWSAAALFAFLAVLVFSAYIYNTLWPFAGLLFLLWGIDVLERKSKKKRSALQEEECRLERAALEFRETVEALREPGADSLECTAELIQDTMLTHTLWITRAEALLDSVRLQREHRDVVLMDRLCTDVLRLRQEMSKAEAAAKLFGVEVDRSALFKEASGRLQAAATA